MLNTKDLIYKIGITLSKEKYQFCSEACFHYFYHILEGKGKPEIMIFPFEPGMGKSRGIQKFLREYKSKGFYPDVGVLIILSRRDEIHEYIKGAGLVAEDYGVLDAHSPMERVTKYGGLFDHTKAPILFTTAQMVSSRCGDDFEKFQDIFYRGKPRALRIWDEEFRFAEAVTVSHDDLATMRSCVRRSHPALADALQLAEDKVRAASNGDVVTMPVMPFFSGKAVTSLTESQVGLLHGISGREGRITIDRGVTYLTAERRRLPANIAPLMVFDASARVTVGYGLMKDAGMPVKVMPGRPLSYEKARFHHMKLGAGRGTLIKNPTRLNEIIFEASSKKRRGR